MPVSILEFTVQRGGSGSQSRPGPPGRFMPDSPLVPDMSLPTALKIVALLFVGLLLIPAFLAMGPLGWVVIGSMFVVGAVQVHQNRKKSAEAGDGRPEYCPNCGAELDDGVFATDDPDDEWEVSYCPDCGAPVRGDDSGNESKVRKVNCPDCGSPNDPTDEKCDYCDAEL